VKVAERLILVVGGGEVAERKVATLGDCKAKIRVISPMATDMLKDLAGRGRIEWIQRQVRSSDARGAYLIIAATDDKVVNERISRWARKNKIWINVVDNAALSDFISPAIFRAGEGIIAVYTDGRDPVLSRDLKNFLKERWDDFLSYRDRL